MTAASALLDEMLADPISAAAQGGVLGYVGLDIPPDVLLANPRGACHLPWQVGVATPRADQWLESSFPGWARSILEDWAAGRFDGFEQVVFTRGEDVSQRLYYYICELQRLKKISGPRPLIFDIARIERESSRRFTQASLTTLVEELGLSAAALRAGIERANALRAAFQRLKRTPRGAGRPYERLVRASLFADVQPALAHWSPSAPVVPWRGRVVLAGSSPPDDRLHVAIETAGWLVAEEFYDRDLERLGPQVVPDAEPVAAIAAAWLSKSFLPRHVQGAGDRLLERVRAVRADAVILWFAREDEALAWQVPALKGAIVSQRLPVQVLSSRAWAFDDGAADEVRVFLEGLQP